MLATESLRPTIFKPKCALFRAAESHKKNPDFNTAEYFGRAATSTELTPLANWLMQNLSEHPSFALTVTKLVAYIAKYPTLADKIRFCDGGSRKENRSPREQSRSPRGAGRSPRNR